MRLQYSIYFFPNSLSAVKEKKVNSFKAIIFPLSQMTTNI